MRASDRAYAELRSEILVGTLPPGTVLGEVDTAARLGVSRTPLREALARLAADGLVGAQAGRGLVVTEISTTGIRELFELRQALEPQAARLAAVRRDPGVFRALAARLRAAADLSTADLRAAADLRTAGDLSAEVDFDQYDHLMADVDAAMDAAVCNEPLVAAMRGVRTHLSRIRRLARHHPHRVATAIAEHLVIVEAIAAGDADLAAHATHVHLHQSLSTILAALAAADPAHVA